MIPLLRPGHEASCPSGKDLCTKAAWSALPGLLQPDATLSIPSCSWPDNLWLCTALSRFMVVVEYQHRHAQTR